MSIDLKIKNEWKKSNEYIVYISKKLWRFVDFKQKVLNISHFDYFLILNNHFYIFKINAENIIRRSWIP